MDIEAWQAAVHGVPESDMTVPREKTTNNGVRETEIISHLK